MKNRARFAVDPSGWFHAAPFGEHPIQVGDTEVVQVIDEAAVAAIEADIKCKRYLSAMAICGLTCSSTKKT